MNRALDSGNLHIFQDAEELEFMLPSRMDMIHFLTTQRTPLAASVENVQVASDKEE
jgi:hypothetical protein